MVRFGIVVDAAGIVKQGEQAHHHRIVHFCGRELQSIAFHP